MDSEKKDSLKYEKHFVVLALMRLVFGSHELCAVYIPVSFFAALQGHSCLQVSQKDMLQPSGPDDTSNYCKKCGDRSTLNVSLSDLM